MLHRSLQHGRGLLQLSSRHFSTCIARRALDRPTDAGSAHIFDKLLASSLSPSSLEVADISGGCGASYSIQIASAQFRGKTPLAQQRLVNKEIKEELQRIHAVQIKCTTPPA